MPKMPKVRRLSDVLEPGFAHGYEGFRELVTKLQSDETLTPHQRAFVRSYELLSVAMIEMMNNVEERFGIPPVEAAVVLWRANGASLAQITAQLITDEGAAVARREMLKSLKEGYDRGLMAMTIGVPE